MRVLSIRAHMLLVLMLCVLYCACVRNPVTGKRQLGLQYMANCGYDPEQMSNFFQIFVGMREESGQSVPNWLSTHPDPPDRILRTTEEGARIKQQSVRRDFKINADEFMPRLDSMVYGDNPREGFFDKGRFVHPDLRFQLDIPQS